MDVAKIQDQLRRFAAERDWDQFHSPKNLVMALAGETGELLDLFQWLTEEQSKQPDSKTMGLAKQEMADVLLYLLRLADKLDIDLEQAALEKIQLNSEKYPVEQARGNADKYNRR